MLHLSGLHNTAIVLPQLIVSLVASAIFGITSSHHQLAKPALPDDSVQETPSIGLELLFLLVLF